MNLEVTRIVTKKWENIPIITMEVTNRDREIERDAAFGGLFQQIINEMKVSNGNIWPWELKDC